MTYSDTDDTLQKRSGWLVPLGVFFVTLILSAIILLYYIAPGAPNFTNERVAPTSRTDVVALRVHGLNLWIPQNYLVYDSSREGGARKEVAMFALLPDMAGWSNWQAAAFADNSPNARIVYMLIRDERHNLAEADRLSRIYLAYVTNPKGKPGPFGLTEYTFREDSGYRNEDLFVGDTQHGPVVLRCVRFSPQVPSPSCLRDMPIAHNVALSYRFKRANLAQWRQIGRAVDNFVLTLKKRPEQETTNVNNRHP